jgi:hypothetical protein
MDRLTPAFLWAGAIALGLAGCATNAQRQAQQIAQNWQTTASELQACTSEVYNAPESEPLRRHLPYNVLNATLEQLTDSAKASDDEIKAIYAQNPKLQECRNSALHSLSTTTPTVVPILIDGYQKNDQIVIDLVQKKITWGEANQRAKALAVQMQKQLTDASQQIEANLERSNAAELAQRQAASNALARYLQTQQMINALNRPVTTNCMGTGYTVNCTTY